MSHKCKGFASPPSKWVDRVQVSGGLFFLFDQNPLLGFDIWCFLQNLLIATSETPIFLAITVVGNSQSNLVMSSTFGQITFCFFGLSLKSQLWQRIANLDFGFPQEQE